MRDGHQRAHASSPHATSSRARRQVHAPPRRRARLNGPSRLLPAASPSMLLILLRCFASRFSSAMLFSLHSPSAPICLGERVAIYISVSHLCAVRVGASMPDALKVSTMQAGYRLDRLQVDHSTTLQTVSAASDRAVPRTIAQCFSSGGRPHSTPQRACCSAVGCKHQHGAEQRARTPRWSQWARSDRPGQSWSLKQP